MRLLLLALCALWIAAAPAAARQGDERLDALFERLAAVENPLEARIVEQAIWQIWLESKSDTVDLLMTHGVKAMEEEDFDRALDIFSTIVELDPAFAEGWNKRATLFYLMGEPEASVKDIEKTLALEPRHFGALAGLYSIMRDRNDLEGALRALTRAVAANPHLPSAKDQLRELTRKVRGDPI